MNTRFLRDALTNVYALAYLALCALLLIWAVVVTVTDDSGESMAGVVPTIATFPVGLLVVMTPDHPAYFFGSIALGALVNATVIGWCARALRRPVQR